MTGAEILAAAVDYVRDEHEAVHLAHPSDAAYPAPVLPSIDETSPIVSMILARWAAYPDPAPLPAGWTFHDFYATATGIRQLASPPVGPLFTDPPGRRIGWTCPAGILHRRYWRSAHHPNRAALVACEHQPEPVRLRP